MFLSKLVLNTRDCQARRDLAAPYELHRTLWRAFPDKEPARIMFRVDPSRTGTASVVLVQSDFQPHWERLANGGSAYLLNPPDWKEFHPSFTPGQRLRFRLRANPTKKVGTSTREDRLAGKRANGQRLALLCADEQLAWLLDKAQSGGFRIPGQWVEATDGRRVPNFRVDVIPEGWVHCGKEGHTDGRFHSVRFEGVLEVADPARLQQTVAAGIGPAKAFGFGLLSLARAEG